MSYLLSVPTLLAAAFSTAGVDPQTPPVLPAQRTDRAIDPDAERAEDAAVPNPRQRNANTDVSIEPSKFFFGPLAALESGRNRNRLRLHTMDDRRRRPLKTVRRPARHRSKT